MEGGVVLKCLFLAALLVVTDNNNWGVDGAGECGTLDPEVLAYKLAPCAAASQDKNVAVPSNCCALVSKVRTNCLCAIMLSKESKSLGIKPDVAVTIPKRCNIPRRSKGYKCGDAGDLQLMWCQHEDDLAKQSDKLSSAATVTVISRKKVPVKYPVPTSSTPQKRVSMPNISPAPLVSPASGERIPFLHSTNDKDKLPRRGFGVRRVLTNYLGVETKARICSNTMEWPVSITNLQGTETLDRQNGTKSRLDR